MSQIATDAQLVAWYLAERFITSSMRGSVEANAPEHVRTAGSVDT